MESRDGPRAWMATWRQTAAVMYRVMREAPPRYWPLSWHVAAAGAAALASLLAVAAWDHALTARQSQASRQLQQALSELALARTAAAGPKEPKASQLPLQDPEHLDRLIADLANFAEPRSLHVGALQLEYSRPARHIQQVRLSTTLSGDYAAIKSWLGELLAGYPGLALQSLSMRANEGRPLEAAVALSLYLRVQP